MSQPSSTSLIFFPGLAADAHMFVPQTLAFPGSMIVNWPRPNVEETMANYCERIAARYSSIDEPVLVGASFGGIIALHVAKRLRTKAVILVGSVRAPEQLSRIIQSCRRFKPIVPRIPVRLFQLASYPFATNFARRLSPTLCAVVRQFRRSDPAVITWSVAQLLEWKNDVQVACPVFQIHGKRDRVLPCYRTKADVILDSGGHLITLTHATEVNQFIRDVMLGTRSEQRKL